MEMYTIEPITLPDELGPEELVALMLGMKTLITVLEVAVQDIGATVPVIDLDE